MTSSEIRQRFIHFFEERGHAAVASSSLVPKNDPSVLFTTAGMQQFKPYYTDSALAQTTFGTKNVVTIQKCVRTGDIDDVGDNTHVTFFEMLGNFSFGGYGRREAIEYAFDFITKDLGLPISYVTFYKGEGVVPRDSESQEIWQSLGVTDIREDGSDVFWGPTGTSGPCGPTTEIYCKNAAGEDVEIWNIVFNEYMCTGSREALDAGTATLTKLDTLGIDTGMGLERLLAIVQKKESVFDTDLLADLCEHLRGYFQLSLPDAQTPHQTPAMAPREIRIIADHMRTATFLIMDGVLPGNKDQGYILRRLIRRATNYIMHYVLLVERDYIVGIVSTIVAKYYTTYAEIARAQDMIVDTIYAEIQKFGATLKQGLKEFDKGADPFTLATTYGFPIELTEELAKEKNLTVDRALFDEKMKAHQETSRAGSEQKFKGGLANTSDMTTKLHTAHHLLLAALQKVLGPDVHQRGSNITDERLRIDFNFDRKLTDEEKNDVEKLVNDWIAADFQVVKKEIPRAEAEALGAEMEFGTKYPDLVSVYVIQDKNGVYISKEFCGGPHVTHTGALGAFKIQKEEASSAGVRRIKAILFDNAL